MKIGSLFSGYEGLGMAVQSVLGGDIAWVSDIDPGACKILAHRYPDVPNIGDITAVDWAAVEPVDVLTGGSPCQDVSSAGKRLGMRAGTRSGLWASMCDAIDIIRPGLVVWENVRGVLSAHADSAVEPCPICVGDERDAHLRALGRVVGDLSELGYVGRWVGLRAADVGAPHGRFRVFVAAWPAGHASERAGDDAVVPVGADGSGGGLGESRGADRWAPADTNSDRLEAASRLSRRPQPEESRDYDRVSPLSATTADAEGQRRHQGWPEPARVIGGSDAALGGDAAADADRGGLARLEAVDGSERTLGRGHADGLGVEAGRLDWGQYTDAIRRWERGLGRPAPAPTELGAKGQPRLSPTFVEWLMGLPAGWVTDVPSLTRNEQLKALGNGVVPQQAAQALRMLLPDAMERAA